MIEIWERHSDSKPVGIFSYTGKDCIGGLRDYLGPNFVIDEETSSVTNGSSLTFYLSPCSYIFNDEGNVSVFTSESLAHNFSFVGELVATENFWAFPKSYEKDANLKEAWLTLKEYHNKTEHHKNADEDEVFYEQLMFARKSLNLICDLEEDYNYSDTQYLWNKRESLLSFNKNDTVIECMCYFDWENICNPSKFALKIYKWFSNTSKTVVKEEGEIRSNYWPVTFKGNIEGKVYVTLSHYAGGDILNMYASLFEAEYNPFC